MRVRFCPGTAILPRVRAGCRGPALLAPTATGQAYGVGALCSRLTWSRACAIAVGRSLYRWWWCLSAPSTPTVRNRLVPGLHAFDEHRDAARFEGLHHVAEHARARRVDEFELAHAQHDRDVGDRWISSNTRSAAAKKSGPSSRRIAMRSCPLARGGDRLTVNRRRVRETRTASREDDPDDDGDDEVERHGDLTVTTNAARRRGWSAGSRTVPACTIRTAVTISTGERGEQDRADRARAASTTTSSTTAWKIAAMHDHPERTFTAVRRSRRSSACRRTAPIRSRRCPADEFAVGRSARVGHRRCHAPDSNDSTAAAPRVAAAGRRAERGRVERGRLGAGSRPAIRRWVSGFGSRARAG